MATRKPKLEFLSHSTDDEINFLLKFISWIVNGDIIISKTAFNKINKDKKISFLNKNFKHQNFQTTLTKKRFQKINILKNIAILLPILFKLLKNERVGR